MKYENMYPGIFLDRPNRFLARVVVNGKKENVHVKNTGRCKELLHPGTKVFLEKIPPGRKRKTQYSLISAYKGSELINMDSQIPNIIIRHALLNNRISSINPDTRIKSEVVYQNSRFDFFYQNDKNYGFIEVKGVTLEDKGIAYFPDAPTERGRKHLKELISSSRDHYNNYIIFVIQMKGVRFFSPNDKTDPIFGELLREAYHSKIHILAYDCIVNWDSIEIDQPVLVHL